MKQQLPRILGACLVAAVVLIYAMTFVVHEGQGALVETFGSVEPVVGTGVHVVWPWPIQKVYRYDLRERLYTGDRLSVTTNDGQLLVAQPFCLWKIVDPAAFRNAVAGSEERAEDLIAGPLARGVNNAFARHPFSDIVRAGSDGDDRPRWGLRTIEGDAKTTLATSLTGYGIDVADVGFCQLVLPAGATKGVFEQMREAKERDAARLESKGKARAEEIRAQAERVFQEGLREARTRAGQTVAAAHAAVAAMLSKAGDKDLLLELEKLEALKNLFANGDTTIVWDPRMPPLDILEELKSSTKATGEPK